MERSDYKVGWICALPLELALAQSMFDETHPDLPRQDGDHHTYSFGRIGSHNVVIACLPSGSTGTNSAGDVAWQLLRTFDAIKFSFMVGIGGGVPTSERDLSLGDEIEHDIRLGDVVISQPTYNSGGVVQYDFGRTVQDGVFERTGSLNRPPIVLMSALASLQAKHHTLDHSLDAHISKAWQTYPNLMRKHQRPDSRSSDLQNCRIEEIVARPPRETDSSLIHYGTIASGNQVMRDGATRDKLAAKLKVLCFEMEAAGLINDFPCIVIRGVSDYADSHKNEQWQGYAAAVAAAYAKELLGILPGATIPSPPHSAPGQSQSGKGPNYLDRSGPQRQVVSQDESEGVRNEGRYLKTLIDSNFGYPKLHIWIFAILGFDSAIQTVLPRYSSTASFANEGSAAKYGRMILQSVEVTPHFLRDPMHKREYIQRNWDYMVDGLHTAMRPIIIRNDFEAEDAVFGGFKIEQLDVDVTKIPCTFD